MLEMHIIVDFSCIHFFLSFISYDQDIFIPCIRLIGNISFASIIIRALTKYIKYIEYLNFEEELFQLRSKYNKYK